MQSKDKATREQIVSSLSTSIRKEVRAAILLVNTMSELTGMHPTDIKCLDFLSDVKFASAGELAKLTGLTTGAVTAVIDRLEKIGFVKREADNKDRRKIIVRIIPEHPNNLELIRNIFVEQLSKNLSEYSNEELTLITNWNKKLSEIFHSEIEKIKSSKKG